MALGEGLFYLKELQVKKDRRSPSSYKYIHPTNRIFPRCFFFFDFTKTTTKTGFGNSELIKKKKNVSHSQADVSPFWPLSRILHKFIYMFGNESDINVLK